MALAVLASSVNAIHAQDNRTVTAIDREAETEPYTLDTGDVLRINIFGEAYYPVDVTVDDAGYISLPLIGEVMARGQSTSELANLIKKTAQDRELISAAIVQLSISKHRPFYITGAVAAPGEYPFKPGMSVRLAIALAGGFKAIPIGTTVPALAIADLRSERDALLIEIYRRRIELARLQAELNDQEDIGVTVDEFPNIPKQLASEIIASEKDQLQAYYVNARRGVQHLTESLARARRDYEVMQNARTQRNNATKLQMEEVEAARLLRSKGLTAKSNVLAAERAQSLYQVDEAELEVKSAEVQQRIFDIERLIAEEKEKRRIATLSQIEEAQLSLGTAHSKLRHVNDKLLFVSEYGEHRSLDDLRYAVSMVIYRKVDGVPETIQADENTPVRAGDLVELSLRPNRGYFEPQVDEEILALPARSPERDEADDAADAPVRAPEDVVAGTPSVSVADTESAMEDAATTEPQARGVASRGVAEPEAEPADTSSAAPSVDETVRVTAVRLNMRDGPGKNAAFVGAFDRGAQLRVLGRVGRWVEAEAPDGRSGWLSARFLETLSDARAAVEGAATTGLQAGEVTTGIGAERASEPVAAAPVAAPAGEVVRVTANRLIMRDGPSKGASVVGAFERGTQLTLLDRDGRWIKAQAPDGRSGWLGARFLETLSDGVAVR